MKDRKEINALIEKVKVFAKENPSAYRGRVFWLGILGYAYIAFVLIALIAMLGGIVWMSTHRHFSAVFVKPVIFLVVVAWLVIKSLWIKVPPPEGVPVKKSDAPKLFAILEDICARQKSPMPDFVFLNNDFNAFISQVPRLGILGWYRNYLVLGLPYMMATDVEQFKAVLAHEFGHFSGAHGKSMVWIYRIRLSWENIVNSFQNQTGNFVFQWFFNWYVPYFNAYAFVLIREHEYEADRCGTAYVGAEVNAQELVAAAVKGDAVGRYWSQVWQRVTDDPIPPTDVFTRAVHCFRQTVPEEQFNGYLRRVFRIRTQNWDTHPALRDRLAAMGYTIDHERVTDKDGRLLDCQKTIEKSAAEELFSDEAITRALDQFNKEWYDEVKGPWKERFDQLIVMKEQLAALNVRAQTAPLSQKDAVDRAYFIDQLRPKSEAIEAIEEVLRSYPDNAAANYRLGELLLEDDQDRGKDFLTKAMHLDSSLSSACLGKISWFHETRGEYGQVEEVLQGYDRSAEKDAKDYAERNSITKKDHFLAHGLPGEVIEDLLTQLKPYAAELKNVYLVQKKMTVYPQEPMYLIAVDGRMKGFHWDAQDFNQKLVEKLCAHVKLKAERGSVLFSVGDAEINKKLKKVPGATVYKGK